MKFMISFTHTKGDMAERVPRWNELSPDERQAIATQFKEFAATLEAEQGTQMVFFDAPANARTLHLDRDGTVAVKNGTLLDGDEFVGGYFVIEAASMDEALEWARRGRWLVGTNEVREIKDLNSLTRS
jgi:hypothetical protein